MKTLNLKEMEMIEGGARGADTPQSRWFTGAMCGATFALLFTGVFAALAGATGPACVAGFLL